MKRPVLMGLTLGVPGCLVGILIIVAVIFGFFEIANNGLGVSANTERGWWMQNQTSQKEYRFATSNGVVRVLVLTVPTGYVPLYPDHYWTGARILPDGSPATIPRIEFQTAQGYRNTPGDWIPVPFLVGAVRHNSATDTLCFYEAPELGTNTLSTTNGKPQPDHTCSSSTCLTATTTHTTHSITNTISFIQHRQNNS